MRTHKLVTVVTVGAMLVSPLSTLAAKDYSYLSDFEVSTNEAIQIEKQVKIDGLEAQIKANIEAKKQAEIEAQEKAEAEQKAKEEDEKQAQEKQVIEEQQVEETEVYEEQVQDANGDGIVSYEEETGLCPFCNGPVGQCTCGEDEMMLEESTQTYEEVEETCYRCGLPYSQCECLICTECGGNAYTCGCWQ